MNTPILHTCKRCGYTDMLALSHEEFEELHSCGWARLRRECRKILKELKSKGKL